MKPDFTNGGILLIDKPLGWTSFDVVNKLRYTLLKHLHLHQQNAPGTKRKIKVGHAGTLDPLATGLLIVCVGKETKNVDTYMATEKEYTGTFCLGATTPSYDRETEPDAMFDYSSVTPERIAAATIQFTGMQQQIPPVFSAIKQDGKRLYQSARDGKHVEPNPRTIEIFEFEITGIQLPLVHFRVVCSKGTYIRSLAHDFGKALGTGAYLYNLRRTRSGNFHVSKAMGIDECVAMISEAE